MKFVYTFSDFICDDWWSLLYIGYSVIFILYIIYLVVGGKMYVCVRFGKLKFCHPKKLESYQIQSLSMLFWLIIIMLSLFKYFQIFPYVYFGSFGMSSVKKVNLWSLFIAYFAELDLYIRYFEGIKTNLSWILCIYVVILYWPVLFVILNYIVWVLRFAFLIISDCFSLFNHQAHKLIIIHDAFWKYYNF